MRRILATIIMLLVTSLSCTSTLQEDAIQTAIAETQKFQLTNTPTITEIPTITPTKTSTIKRTQTETPNLTPSDTPTITETSTLTPSPSPTEDLTLDLKLQDFDNYYNSLTDLQQETFLQNLSGKTVDWNGYIDDVYDNGTVVVHIPNTFIGTVYLKHVPLEIAATINKASNIRFTGTIEKATDLLSLSIYITDVIIIK